MKKMFEQLNTQIGYTPLSSDEKDAMKNAVYVFVENYSKNNTEHAYAHVFKLFIFKLRPMFIALCIALVLSGGTVFAAENALPGDVLYPVKIHVTEQLRDVVEISPKNQAAWDLQKAERRLVEAQKLAQKGNLTAEVAADLSGRVDTFFAQAESVGVLDGKGSVLPVRGHIQALLRAQSDILDSMVTTTVTGTPWKELGSLLTVLKEKNISVVTTTTSTRETGASFEMAARGRERAAEHKLAEVESYILRKFPDFSVSSTTQIVSVSSTSLEIQVRMKIQHAKNLLSEGKRAVEQATYARAFALFGESMTVAQEAKILVSTARELKIDLHRERVKDSVRTSTPDTRERERAERTEDGGKPEQRTDDRNSRPVDRDARGRNDDRSAEIRVETPVGGGSVNIQVR